MRCVLVVSLFVIACAVLMGPGLVLGHLLFLCFVPWARTRVRSSSSLRALPLPLAVFQCRHLFWFWKFYYLLFTRHTRPIIYKPEKPEYRIPFAPRKFLSLSQNTAGPTAGDPGVLGEFIIRIPARPRSMPVSFSRLSAPEEGSKAPPEPQQVPA